METKNFGLYDGEEKTKRYDMEENEAPEKIYIDDPTGEFDDHWSIYQNNDSVEYTRTDAFIEKAAAWLEEHKEAVETEDNGIMGWIPDYFIEDFKKYMKKDGVK